MMDDFLRPEKITWYSSWKLSYVGTSRYLGTYVGTMYSASKLKVRKRRISIGSATC